MDTLISLFFLFLIPFQGLSAFRQEVQQSDKILISPPMRHFNGKYLRLKMPAGWKLIEKDTPDHWQTSNYNFAILRTKSASRLDCQLRFYPYSRANRKDDLTGKRYRNHANLTTFYHEYVDRTQLPRIVYEYRWSFVYDASSVVIIDLWTEEGSQQTRQAAHRFVNSLQFLTKPSAIQTEK